MPIDPILPRPPPIRETEKGHNSIWLHTIGRVSNLIRVVMSVSFGVLQTGKIIAKIALLPITYTIAGIHYLASTKKTEHRTNSMTLTGIAMDGLGLLRIAGTAAKCFVRVVVAPTTNSASFKYDAENLSSIIEGTPQHKLQTHIERYPKFVTIQQIFQLAFQKSTDEKRKFYD
jgi:hypothetical protein